MNQKVLFRFYYTGNMERKLKEAAEKQASEETARLLEEEMQAEAHRRKYAIVERIRQEMEFKDAQKELSVVESYAARA
jgi:hypothetical protein